MLWTDVLAEMTHLETSGPEGDVSGVQYDSRRVVAGDVFVAMRGESADGNRYVEQALRGGAAALVMDSPEVFARLKKAGLDVGLALVGNGRRALAEASAAVFAHPERQLAISAVTGTNGKTTTAWVLEQLLRSAGRKSVLVGTIETHVADEVRSSPHTTPESRDLLETFADGVRMGCTEAVMEASSHALVQERIWRMPIDVAIWTNLTQDHLDYHGSMERYFAAKQRLFRGVGTPPPRVAVINVDDAPGNRLAEMVEAGTEMRYGLDAGEYRAEEIRLSVGSTRFTLQTPHGSMPMSSPLAGRVNVYNVLAATCAGLARGLTLEEMATATERLRQVPGRFQRVVSVNSGITAVVDYAHTDDALRNLILFGRELVAKQGGRVITVFGCGGDRDRLKRPKMGRAAAEGSDLVVVTSDNPRSEAPSRIIEEILEGMETSSTACVVEEDRAGAIAIALRSASPGDLVLIAGKGHERMQIVGDQTLAFDDVAVAEDVLRDL